MKHFLAKQKSSDLFNNAHRSSSSSSSRGPRLEGGHNTITKGSSGLTKKRHPFDYSCDGSGGDDDSDSGGDDSSGGDDDDFGDSGSAGEKELLTLFRAISGYLSMGRKNVKTSGNFAYVP